jgi:hypothetical protein
MTHVILAEISGNSWRGPELTPYERGEIIAHWKDGKKVSRNPPRNGHPTIDNSIHHNGRFKMHSRPHHTSIRTTKGSVEKRRAIYCSTCAKISKIQVQGAQVAHSSTGIARHGLQDPQAPPHHQMASTQKAITHEGGGEGEVSLGKNS